MPNTTTDHDKIRKWVEDHGGEPAMVKGLEQAHDPAALLRIDFHSGSHLERLDDISWDDFFQKFDQGQLEFVYEEDTPTRKSRFVKFIHRKAG